VSAQPVAAAAVPARTRSRALARVAHASTTTWLVGLIGLSAVVHFAIAWWMPAPWIFADELKYSELAKSFAASGHFSVRDVPTLGSGPLYPILISPAYALFESVPHAYAAIKAINSVVMSLAAVPTYLLARRLVTRGWAIATAALCLAIPSLAYTGVVMTENLFFPLFVASVWGVVRALETPTVKRQLGALVLIGLALLTRPEAVALVPALLTAIALMAVGDAAAADARPRAREAFRSAARFWPSYLMLSVVALAVVARPLARGQSPSAAFGDASVVWHASYSVGGVARWFVYHLGELDLYSGILPFAAFLVLCSLVFDRSDRGVRVFGAAAGSAVLWLLLTTAAFVSSVSSYDVHTTSRIVDRYTFHALPLLLIALVAWLRQRLPASIVKIVIAAAVAGVLPLVVPYSTYVRNDEIPDAFGLLPWAVRRGPALVAAPHVELRVALISFVLACLFVLLRPPRMPSLVASLVALVMIAVLSTAVVRTHATSSFAALWIGSDTGWVDEAIGPNADVPVIWSGRGDPHVVWENEFFNRSVGTVYYLRQPSWEGLAEQKLVVRRGTLVDGSGAPLRVRYALADPWVVLRGRVIGRDETSGMRLYRLDGRPARIGAL
jgi:Dolichyl-phosphate-mannose-protein mannosyltransferase